MELQPMPSASPLSMPAATMLMLCCCSAADIKKAKDGNFHTIQSLLIYPRKVCLTTMHSVLVEAQRSSLTCIMLCCAGVHGRSMGSLHSHGLPCLLQESSHGCWNQWLQLQNVSMHAMVFFYLSFVLLTSTFCCSPAAPLGSQGYVRCQGRQDD